MDRTPPTPLPEKDDDSYQIGRSVGAAIDFVDAVGTAAYGIASLFSSSSREVVPGSILGSSSTGGSDIKWKPPKKGWYKVNTDGSCRHEEHISAVGGLIRDCHGVWKLGFHKEIDWCQPDRAELRGIYYGLKVAWERGFRRIIVESDNKTVVSRVKRIMNIDNHCNDILVMEIKELCQRRWETIEVDYFPREGNDCADRLAKMAIDERPKVLKYFDEPPQDHKLIDFLLADKPPTPPPEKDDDSEFKIGPTVGAAIGLAAVVGTVAYGIASLFSSSSREEVPRSVLGSSSTGGSDIKWQPPEKGWYKVNTDGSCRHVEHISAVGGLIRDCNCEWKLGFLKEIDWKEGDQPDKTELWGIYYGLLVAWNRRGRFNRIIVESDNKTVVEKINNLFSENNDLLEAIQKLLQYHGWMARVEYIPRQGNACADYMANMAATKRPTDLIVYEERPPYDLRLQRLLSEDKPPIMPSVGSSGRWW